MKRIFLIITMVALCLHVLAQGAQGPDLQTNDQVFFDPNAGNDTPYEFKMEYRLEGGYVQNWQNSKDKFSRMYLHGGRIGMTFDFMLPYHFSVQTGLLYTLTYGKSTQKWGVYDEEESYATTNAIEHRVTEHWLAVPMRVYYNIKLWKKLNLFFLGGPQLMIGLAEIDNMDNQLPPMATQFYKEQGVPVERYDRFKDELYPVNIQIGVGGGLEWDCYRLQAGYDFGLNNQIRHRNTSYDHMWEWSWFVSFAYRLPLQ